MPRPMRIGSGHSAEFVTGPYFDFYGRKWKRSTKENNVNRVSVHLVASLGQCELVRLQAGRAARSAWTQKAKSLSFSVVDHLRWDLKQIFDMAVAEGLIERNPALLLFTPKEAAKPVRRVMNLKEVQIYFEVLAPRERLIAKLAVIAGLRPGEIFGLTWGRLTAKYADIRQRVYRGTIDTPKTDQSVRHAASARRAAAGNRSLAGVLGRDARGCVGVSVRADDAALQGQLLAAVDVAEAGQGRLGLGEFSGDAPDARNLNEGVGCGWEAGRRSARP